MKDFVIKLSAASDVAYAEEICQQIEESAKARGTGIAKRSVAYIQSKIEKAEAFIAVDRQTSRIAGFCYVEFWGHGKYIANDPAMDMLLQNEG